MKDLSSTTTANGSKQEEFNKNINLYFNNLPIWDGIDHIGRLSEYLNVSDVDEIRFKTQLRKMFIRITIGALGIRANRQAFVIINEKQNSGKTTLLRWLVPEELKGFYNENIELNKDSRIALGRTFIENLDEISLLAPKEVNELESILREEYITERLSYEKESVRIPRRCSFIGSTNCTNFLSNSNGDILNPLSWVCFAIKYINWDYKEDIDIDKIYAQAYHLHKKGETGQLTLHEIGESKFSNTKFYTQVYKFDM